MNKENGLRNVLIDLFCSSHMADRKVDISNIGMCVEDAKRSWLLNEMGPPDPVSYIELKERLANLETKLPPLYRKTVYEPYLSKLNESGETGFTSILLSDPTRERIGLVMLDIAQSILQNGERYNEMAIDAFQEVVSDLYDGFLSAEDRSNVKPPDHMVIPPLVKFGEPTSGPYTIKIEAAKAELRCANNYRESPACTC